jgi:NTP pyrophosphatase (non-canonical NTP hydrolase)
MIFAAQKNRSGVCAITGMHDFRDWDTFIGNSSGPPSAGGVADLRTGFIHSSGKPYTVRRGRTCARPTVFRRRLLEPIRLLFPDYSQRNTLKINELTDAFCFAGKKIPNTFPDKFMARQGTAESSAQILLFPNPGPELETLPTPRKGRHSPADDAGPAIGSTVVLCGTYRKDPEGLRRTFENLRDSGFTILSPSNPFIESEKDGFVYMQKEGTQSPDKIENRHLDAIQRADFVWFFAPDGYVGPTGALEVGFARANGIPVFSDTPLFDTTIKHFVEIVESPLVVQNAFALHRFLPPPPAVKTFQHYYRRAALQRGYAQENPKDCLLLMVEEVGELARALRKRANLVRHGSEITNQESLELADVFIYVVHMANILKIDLSKVVQEKELINIKKMIDAK